MSVAGAGEREEEYLCSMEERGLYGSLERKQAGRRVAFFSSAQEREGRAYEKYVRAGRFQYLVRKQKYGGGVCVRGSVWHVGTTACHM